MYTHRREVAAIILDPERALRRTMDADRILCTHTGSLPRPDDLVQIMWAVGDGIPVDAAALEARVEAAVCRHRPPAGRCRRVDRQRRGDVQTVLRDVRQGPPQRVRR